MPKLTPAEVTEICTAGAAAWDALPPTESKATFTWKGERYVARHTGFRLCIDTPEGEPVACRYD